jgi:hypothetical protein
VTSIYTSSYIFILDKKEDLFSNGSEEEKGRKEVIQLKKNRYQNTKLSFIQSTIKHNQIFSPFRTFKSFVPITPYR